MNGLNVAIGCLKKVATIWFIQREYGVHDCTGYERLKYKKIGEICPKVSIFS